MAAQKYSREEEEQQRKDQVLKEAENEWIRIQKLMKGPPPPAPQPTKEASLKHTDLGGAC